MIQQIDKHRLNFVKKNKIKPTIRTINNALIIPFEMVLGVIILLF
jgi:hypothetical protein